MFDKVKECGEVVGLSVDSDNGGWNSLYEFAHKREQENMEAYAAMRTKGKKDPKNYEVFPVLSTMRGDPTARK